MGTFEERTRMIVAGNPVVDRRFAVVLVICRLNDMENGAMTMKADWVGCMVVIGYICIARFVIRFLKNAAEA